MVRLWPTKVMTTYPAWFKLLPHVRLPHRQVSEGYHPTNVGLNRDQCPQGMRIAVPSSRMNLWEWDERSPEAVRRTYHRHRQ
ncbi:hypothetical protein PP761_gp89 [Stenotrophomonas phage Paxi]|uniref:Uncharacterized protein n=1 Tax=Stenotrophomonas phage Paxi TaxID=2859653 RepID=A0AAE7WLQ9_9CAUD|nr:hypothetical protein PP761_gp89 [Stenotrophomonas phage Paxi]QYW01806.1 hypothetical protein CPT_Paxi_038 [Stenotrophomonas phage Paxi]